MQHMQAPPGGACQPQHALGGDARGFHVAPDRMDRGSPRAREMLARDQAVFVFGMDRDAAPAALQRRRMSSS